MSITFFDKNKPPSSKWVYEPVPDFNKTKERERYWDREMQRWIEGHAGLTGYHYYYLQMVWLQLLRGNFIRPWWRDTDDDFFCHIKQTWDMKMTELIFKRRRWGLTSMGAGCFPSYFARVDKGSITNMTSKDQPTLYNLFTEKFMIAQDRTHEDVRGSYDSRYGGSLSKTRTQVGAVIALNSKDDKGNDEVKYSKIFCRESSESDDAASKFSGSGVNYAFIDEAAVHKRLPLLLSSLLPTLKVGMVQEGRLLIGGSMEDNISQECLSQLQLLKDNADTYNMRWMFIPGYVGMEGYEINGNSDVKGATEAILREREKLDRSPDKTALRGFIKSHPLTIDELFEMGGVGFWEEPSLAIMNEVRKKISVTPPPITPVSIVELGHEIKVNVVRDAPTIICENPRESVNYIIGVDSIGEGKKGDRKTKMASGGDANKSKFAAIVIKQLDKRHDDFCEKGDESSYTPVALYYDLPNRIQDAYAKVGDLIKLYNQFGTPDYKRVSVMPEANMATSDHFSSYLEGQGMGHFLMNRQDLSGKKNTNTNKIGTYVTIDVFDWQKKEANIYIQKYGYRMKMMKVLEDLFNLGVKNADIGSAFLAALVGMGNKYDKEAPPAQPPAPRWTRLVENGENIWIEEQQPLSVSSEPPVPQYIEFMGFKTLILPPKR